MCFILSFCCNPFVIFEVFHLWFLGRFIMCFCGKALPLNKVGCTREYITKLRICFDIPLICTTFAAVECVFAYRCLFPHLQHAHADGLFNNGLHFEKEI